MCVCVSVYVYVHVGTYGGQKDVRCSEAGIIGGCECSSMGAENQAMVPFKNSKHS